MSVKAYTLEQVSGQIPNYSIKEVLSLSQPPNTGCYHSMQKQGDPHRNWYNSSRITHVDEFLRNRIVENVMQKRNPAWEQCVSNHVTDLKSQLSTDAALKEYMNQEVLPCQLQNLIQHEISNAKPHQQVARCLTSSLSPTCMTTPALGISLRCGSYSPYPEVDHFMVGSCDYNASNVNNIIDSNFIEGSPCNGHNQGVATAFIGCDDWKDMFSPVGTKQLSKKMVPSPEPISCITAGSDGDGYSDSEPFDGGPTFSGSSSQYISDASSEANMQQQQFDQGELNLIKHKGFTEKKESVYHVDFPSLLRENEIPQQDPPSVPEASDVLPSVVFNTSRSTCDDLLQSHLQMPGSQQFHQLPQQPHVWFDEPHEAQSHWYSVEQDDHFNRVSGQNLSELPQLPSEQSHGAHHDASESPAVFSGSTRISEPSDQSILSLHDILLSYINYKSMPVKMGGSQVPFLNFFHLAVCNVNKCKCDQYHLLVSHFDNCNYANCDLCGPVRRLCNTSNVHLGSGKPKSDLSRVFYDRDFDSTGSDTIEDILPPPKRLKGNCFSFGNRVSHAVAHIDQPCVPEQFPHSGQWPEAPLFYNADAMGVKRGLLSHTEDPVSRRTTDAVGVNKELLSHTDPVSASITRSDITDNAQGVDFNGCEQGMAVMSVSKELLSHTEDPTSTRVSRNDVTDNGQEFNFNNAPMLCEDLIGCREGEAINHTSVSEIRNDVTYNFQGLNSGSMPVLSEASTIGYQQEEIQVRSMLDEAKSEAKGDLIAPASDNESGMMSVEPKALGVSLTDFFTAEQMKEHISSFSQWIGQSFKREVTGSVATQSISENVCQLCFSDKLVFAPAPMYCSCCSARIKRNLIYYRTLDETGTQLCFCTLCFRESRGTNISFRGVSISKEKLQKERNNEENEEPWVECDKCKRWQHQICALYNDKRDLEGKSEYICPHCFLEEIEIGARVPLPKTAAFGTKDLQSTMLSDHIEQRLFRCLKQEREERARFLGKSLDEVPGAADLVVRVVLSVNKLLKVKKQFLDIFHSQNYPAEFPYRSKVILLFQKIEGVDVCLFGMYVQEFGSECCRPNHRCVYISYLDSVKYFRPDIETVSGEALRTFVYHQILIGYLDYCKKRGFATCYIWACPPLRGEDYILYCHPETQKTPKSDKLRQWYKSMLRKAAKDNVVVDHTNFYNHFFVPTGDNTKITAARLPYFDGDYWSGAIEDTIRNIEQESGGGMQKKVKKLMTKRTLKAMGHSNPSGDATKDVLVMQKLGQTILPVKEDFIIVHLQFTCTRCHEVILSGSRWLCNQCKSFQLCARCLDLEQNLDDSKAHTSISGEKHLLSRVFMNDVAVDTEDGDVLLDNGFFENRHTFLGFCQSNHYQFDTLRRAKHSSMMILHHLHKLTALTVGTTCSICHKDALVDQQWHCEICPDFSVCVACYHKKDSVYRIHKLTHHSSGANCAVTKKQAQQHKALWPKKALDVLMHASQCRASKSNPCSYPRCLQIKMLFRHSHQCTLRVAGGCEPCKKTWLVLQLHSRNCRDSDCRVPRCMDLKKHVEMLASQSETR